MTDEPCGQGLAVLGLAGFGVGVLGAAWTIRLGYALVYAYYNNEHSPRPYR